MGDRLNTGDPIGFRQSCYFQRIAYVFGDCHMGVERVVLEHHCTSARTGLEIIDDNVANLDLTITCCFQPGDHAEQGGFATTRRAKNDNKFACFDGEIDFIDDCVRTEFF